MVQQDVYKRQVETTAEDYSRQMKVNRHPSTGAIQSIWSKAQGLLQAVGEGNRLTLEWYAPGPVSYTHLDVYKRQPRTKP